MGERQQRGRAASAEVVGRFDQRECLGGVGAGAVEVTGEQGESGALHEDLRGELVEQLEVEDDRRRCRAVQRRLHQLEQWLDAGRVARGHPRSDQGDGEHGPVVEDVVGQSFEPASEGAFLTALAHRRGGELDQPCGIVDVVTGHRVFDGLGGFAVGGVPSAGSSVQFVDQVRVFVGQSCAEHVGEQVVIPVPVASIVERDEEQVRTVELFQRRSPVGSRGDRVAESAGQAVEHRGLQQERSDRFGLAVEHLLDEVVDDEAVVAGEVVDERSDVVAVVQRQRCELQRGDPTFGPRFQRADLGGGEVQVHRVVEVARRFVGGEAEVGGADLEQLAAGAPSCERQRRIGPGGEHEVEAWRCVFDEEADRVVDVGRVDDVVVVQHEDDVDVEPFQVVDQRRCCRVQRLGRLQQRFSSRADLWRDRSKRRDEVRAEDRRVVVCSIERQPRGAAVGV